MLEHWQGHRRLTRRVIEAFPEDKLFTYSLGGMRTFGAMMLELTGLTGIGMKSMIDGNWVHIEQVPHNDGKMKDPSRKNLLALWDEVTEEIEAQWPKISSERFLEVEAAYQLYEGPIYSMLLYWIDNEVHHRGQGYVYLRSLGIQPPFFWERS